MGVQRLNTRVKMSKYVLIRTGHVDFCFEVNGKMHLEAVSISYDNMEHLEACSALSDGLEFMCIDLMGMTVEQVVDELRRQGKYKGKYQPERKE